MEQKEIQIHNKNSLVDLVREGVHKVATGATYAAGLFAMGSLIYSLGVVSIFPNSKINRFPLEHPEVVQYYKAKSDYERIAIEEENPNLQQTLREYHDIHNEDIKYMFYMMGGLATAIACAGIAGATESKKKKLE